MPTNLIPNYFAFTSKHRGIVSELATEIGLSLPYDQSYTGVKPKRISKIAIWDTGAQGTVISTKIARELKLKPVGKVNVRGVNLTIESNVYLVNLYLPNKITIPFVPVTEGNITSDVLVGMDIITLGDFSITNFNKKTIFSFRIPSKRDVDFVDEMKTSINPQKNKRSGKIRRTDRCYCGSGKMYKNCHGK